MPLYTEQQRFLVVKQAVTAVKKRVAGASRATLGNGSTAQVFDLVKGGYCNRFVRQCFETALEMSPFSWYFGAAKACQTLEKLEPYRLPNLDDLKAGDILGFNGDPGHIAIYVGTAFDPTKDLVAENTISSRRGYPQSPGTKVSSLHDEVTQHNWTHAYRLFV